MGIELVRDGNRQELSDQTRSQIADQLPKLFSTCSINSRDHPQTFASWSLTTIWEDAQVKDHLTVQFASPIELRAGHSSVISVQQFLLGLNDPRFPGPELSRHGEQVVAYVKCSGIDLIKFVCAPDVKGAMPGSYYGLCRHIEHSKQSPPNHP